VGGRTTIGLPIGVKEASRGLLLPGCGRADRGQEPWVDCVRVSPGTPAVVHPA